MSEAATAPRLPECAPTTLRARSLAALLHRLPLTGDFVGRIAMHAARRSGVSRRSGPAIAQLRNGVRIPVRLNDYNGRMIYFFGTADPRVVGTCRSLLRAGDVFLDIGANLGTIGLQCVDRVGPAGAIHQVEPQPELARGIRAGAADAGFTNVHVHECGLWDEDGELRIAIPDAHTGAAHILAEGAGGADDEASTVVPVHDTRRFIAETAGDRPFGAKVDVEGAEDRILPALFAAPNARFVLFENHHLDDPGAYWPLVEEDRFTFLGLKPALASTHLVPVTERERMRGWYDLLAVRAPRAAIGTAPLRPAELARRVEAAAS